MNLYFIPGTQCDERLWTPVWAALPETIQPNYIPIPEGRNTVDIAGRIAQTLPSGPVNLVGFSMGGYLATQLACLYPGRVARLMVIANSPAGLSDSEIEQRKRYVEKAIAQGYQGLTRTGARRLLHPAHRDRDDLIDSVIGMDRAGGEAQFLQQMQATSHREDLTGSLTDRRLPIRYLYGDADRLVSEDVLSHLAFTNPCIEIRRLDGAGHMLPLEDPVTVADEIVDWFG